eukprot:gb/GECH01010908.1/.p1 GENE.gb/GECH01010908.1/~~gb/GECH01010908.1/.p1  ORF type:complete len:529 (+),score=60.25 gb/GECH01010908.1/:1-1587(+)
MKHVNFQTAAAQECLKRNYFVDVQNRWMHLYCPRCRVVTAVKVRPASNQLTEEGKSKSETEAVLCNAKTWEELIDQGVTLLDDMTKRHTARVGVFCENPEHRDQELTHVVCSNDDKQELAKLVNELLMNFDTDISHGKEVNVQNNNDNDNINRIQKFKEDLQTLRESNEEELFLCITRTEVLSSLMQRHAQIANNAREKWHITFQGEDAIDAGAPRKECYRLFAKEITSVDAGFFSSVDNQLLHPKNDPFQFEKNKQLFLLLGIICGKAVLNNDQINLPLSDVMLKVLLKERIGFDDFKKLDDRHYTSLMHMICGDAMQMIDEGYTGFTADEDVFGKRVTRSLLRTNDDNDETELTVNHNNKWFYAKLYAQYKMFGHDMQLATLMKKFAAGFYKVIPEEHICGRLTPEELRNIICGKKADFSDLISNTDFQYADEDTTQWFIGFCQSATYQTMTKLITFTTGSDRLPAGGASQLNYNITIITREDREGALPSSNSCFNLLNFPKYGSQEQFNERLTLALENCDSFGLI